MPVWTDGLPQRSKEPRRGGQRVGASWGRGPPWLRLANKVASPGKRDNPALQGGGCSGEVVVGVHQRRDAITALCDETGARRRGWAAVDGRCLRGGTAGAAAGPEGLPRSWEQLGGVGWWLGPAGPGCTACAGLHGLWWVARQGVRALERVPLVRPEAQAGLGGGQ
jgi:hypothetical protein